MKKTTATANAKKAPAPTNTVENKTISKSVVEEVIPSQLGFRMEVGDVNSPFSIRHIW